MLGNAGCRKQLQGIACDELLVLFRGRRAEGGPGGFHDNPLAALEIEAHRTEEPGLRFQEGLPIDQERVEEAWQEATQRDSGIFIDAGPQMAQQILEKDLVPPFVDKMLP